MPGTAVGVNILGLGRVPRSPGRSSGHGATGPSGGR